MTVGTGDVTELQGPRVLIVDSNRGCVSAAQVSGINLVGHPPPQPGLTCRAWLAADDPSVVSSIVRLDAATGSKARVLFSTTST